MALDTSAAPPSMLDRYELLKEQGDGGFGSVWIARTDEAGDPPPLYSLLRVHRHLVKKPEAAETFVAEVRKDLAFRSPTTLGTVDAGVRDGEIFVVSQYVEGESLAALLAAAGAEGLPTPILLRILLDVIASVAAAHTLEKPVTHGEISPQHIRVGVDGVARIGGYGSARALVKLSVQGTKSHDRLSYAAPERVKGMASTSAPQVALEPRADVFSLGVLVWEAIARQRLFASRIEAAVIQKVLTAPIAALSAVPGITVPPRMDELVTRALERDPARRLPTAVELFKGLEAAGQAWVASYGEVAARLEKLVGKVVSERRMELAAALGRKAPEPAGARPGSSPAVNAASAPAAPASEAVASEAAAPKPAAVAPKAPPAPARPAVPAVSKPLPGPAAPKAPVISAGAAKPAAPVVGARSVPNRQATMLGGMVAKPAAPAPAAEAKKEPTVSAPAVDELDISFADVAPVSAPSEKVAAAPAPVAAAKPAEPAKPVVAKPVTSLRGTTTRGGFGAAPLPAPRPEPAPAINVPAAASASPAAAAASASPAAGVRAITKPRAGQVIPIHEAAAPDEVASKPAAATVESAAPANEPAPDVKASAASATSDRATGSTPISALVRGRAASAIDGIGPGSTLGRYEILMPLARGGMAEVWAARLQGSRGFQKLVAIKTMLSDVSDDPDFETMFLDEATVAARIRHPNVAEIMDLGEDHDVLYLVMEWIDGENLSTIIRGAKAVGGIPLPVVLRIASQACAGLHAAHELRDDSGNLVDLIHRDVSPANVLVSTTGFVKLVDFGVAKSKNRMHVTRAGGMVKGKTPYLSPEQLGQLPLDRRSDIFSFGVLLYVLATGLHPFRGETEGKTIENIALREPVSLHTINPKIPIEFERVVFKALQKDREKRYATAAELQRALDQVAVSMGIPASDAEVADFVRGIIGEASQKRAQDIRAAIASLEASIAPVLDASKAEARGPESKTPKGGVEAPKPSAEAPAAAPPRPFAEASTAASEAAKPAPEALEEPLPTASTRVVPVLAAAAAEEDISVEAELPQLGADAVAAQPAGDAAGPPSAREAELPTVPFAPTPAVMGLPAGGLPGRSVPHDDRTPPSSILDEETSTPESLAGGRARRSRTVAIVVGVAVTGVAVAAGLALMFSKGAPSASSQGLETTAAVSSLVPAGQPSSPPLVPSAAPSAAPPVVSATATTPEPPAPPTVAPDVPLDPPLFAKGKVPPPAKAPPAKPGTAKAPSPPPPPPPAKPPTKPPKYNPTGI